MNKKLIVGTLAILVVLMAVQGFRPVLADNDSGGENMDSNTPFTVFNSFNILVVGQGSVCWSSDYTNGCTQSSATVPIQDGHTVTLKATGVDGSQFDFWDTNSPSMSSWASAFNGISSPILTVNPYNLPAVDAETISAIFN